jgi:8-oxo-dGTP pyrophosphatase MutT (NUDIX family)
MARQADVVDRRARAVAPRGRLADLVEPGVSRAASLLLAEEGRFLLGARPPLEDRGHTILRLTGIGGWAEGEESFVETVRREALEETGSDVRLFTFARTVVVRSPDDSQLVPLTDRPSPLALVFRRFGTGPFDPWSDDYQRVAPVAVFAGALTQFPRLSKPDEHPFFLWVHPEQMIALSDADVPLEYLLNDGADLFGAFTGDAGRALVRLTDSIQALLTALGPRSFTLLSDIARLTQTASIE